MRLLFIFSILSLSVFAEIFNGKVSLFNTKIRRSRNYKDFHFPNITVNGRGRITNITTSGFSIGSRHSPVHRPGRFINVRDYNVTGNGITDDTDAIQRLLDDPLISAIWFPEGNYITTDTLNLTQKANFKLYGSGFGSTGNELVRSIIAYRGTGTIFHMLSCQSTEIAYMGFDGLYGGNTSYGIKITAINSLGSSHWNTIHDVSVNFVIGNPGIGLYIGSETHDDVSHTLVERYMGVLNNYDVVQTGANSVTNAFKDVIMLEFKKIGMWIKRGDATLRDCRFYGGSTATDDYRGDPLVVSMSITNSYHELLWNRLNASAYNFPFGPEEPDMYTFPVTLKNSRILSNIDESNKLFIFNQSGPLDVHDVTFGGLRGGIIYLRNYNELEPQPLSWFNNKYILDVVEDIEGNWDYQGGGTRQIYRKLLHSTLLENISTPQDIFPQNHFKKQMILQSDITYNVKGEIYLATLHGNVPHQIGILYGGSKSPTYQRLSYTTHTTEVQYGLTSSPSALTTQLSGLHYLTPLSNNTRFEFSTIIVSGVIVIKPGSGHTTWIPKIKYSVPPGGHTYIQALSYFQLLPIGSFSVSEIN